MERLTEKGSNSKTPQGIARHFFTIMSITKQMLRDMYYAQYDKLHKLEDLEDQIGMPLEVLFNVVGKDIYIVDPIDNTYHALTINTFYLYNSIYYLSYVDSMGLDMSVKSNDFNKTWFLTHEENQKKLEEMKNEN